MSKRDAAIAAFLNGTPWVDWLQDAIPADASTRRYLRLSEGSETVILMDADPAKGQDVEPFVKVGAWLQDGGFASPAILKADSDKGFLIIEDLGLDDFAAWITRHPSDAKILYTAATDVLIDLESTPPPSLPMMTAQVGGDMLDVTAEWYAETEGQKLIDAMTDHLDRLCGAPNHIALRDFHVENLIWRPDHSGHARVGLLDFQDAFCAPRGYDLVSLLRDVRRRVDPKLAAKMTERFIAGTGADAKTADAAFACLAAQRNLRILGVFARLARRDEKVRYLQWVPHVWSLIQDDLSHPALRKLKSVVDATLPPPERSAIKDLL